MSPISSACHDERFSLIFTYLPFYFNLTFPVFFHSSVLMHPGLHTDLDNMDSVENNLRHSGKGSLDAYDVIESRTCTKVVGFSTMFNFETFPEWSSKCLNPLVGSLAFYMQQCVFICTVLGKQRSSVFRLCPTSRHFPNGV